jgi:hypothetical protein
LLTPPPPPPPYPHPLRATTVAPSVKIDNKVDSFATVVTISYPMASDGDPYLAETITGEPPPPPPPPPPLILHWLIHFCTTK